MHTKLEPALAQPSRVQPPQPQPRYNSAPLYVTLGRAFSPVKMGHPGLPSLMLSTPPWQPHTHHNISGGKGPLPGVDGPGRASGEQRAGEQPASRRAKQARAPVGPSRRMPAG